MRGDTLVISGASGFVGRHVAASLLAAGWHLLVLIRADSDRSRLPHAPGQLSLVDVADLGDASVRSRLGGCAAWINAATAYGRGNAGDAERVRFANVDYPSAILDSVIDAGCRRVLHFDSFFTKDELVHDDQPGYTAAKKEFVGRARARVAGTGTTFLNLRLEHVYGPLDDRRKFVSWLLGQLLSGAPRIPLTAGLQERDFVFVDDAVAATRVLLEAAPEAPGVVTTVPVGTGVKTSIRNFATLAREVAGAASELDFGAVLPEGRGIDASYADTSFLRALGWQSRTSLADGIARTLADLKARAAAAASAGR